MLKTYLSLPTESAELKVFRTSENFDQLAVLTWLYQFNKASRERGSDVMYS